MGSFAFSSVGHLCNTFHAGNRPSFWYSLLVQIVSRMEQVVVSFKGLRKTMYQTRGNAEILSNRYRPLDCYVFVNTFKVRFAMDKVQCEEST